MIRRYTPHDKARLIQLLKLHTPQFFDLSEEAEFAEYLEHFSENYYVMEEQGKIIAGGGINYFFDEGVARISWDLVDPGFQGKGVGRKLTLFRIEEIKRNTSILKIVVRTSQLAFFFYEKLGFTLKNIEKDFWADGYDLYFMEMEVGKNGKT